MLCRLAIVFGLILTCAIPALSQDQPAQPLGIPTPPGATVTMELNMSREQIIGQLALLTSGIGPGSSLGLNISPADMQDALGGLQTVQFMEMKLPANYQPSDILGLFSKEVGGRRVIYDVSTPDSVKLLLSTDGGGYFGAMIDSEKDKSGKITSGRLRAARLYGFPDIQKVARIALPAILKLGFTLPGLPIAK